MSARAAWRLESLGFTRVYRYDAGKADWSAAGSRGKPAQAFGPIAADVARRDVPACRLPERLEDVRARVRAAGWETCMVVNEAGVVLGRVGKQALDSADARTTAQEAMASGPSTFRPDVPLTQLVEYMRAHDLTTAPITTSDGVLVGLMLRQDAEHRIHLSHTAASDAPASRG
jgi:hypothetical protein